MRDRALARQHQYRGTAARFFINGLASTTKGIDAVAHYRWRTESAGAFDFTLAGNINKIDVTRVPTSTATLNPAPTLVRAQPYPDAGTGHAGREDHRHDRLVARQLGAHARVTYYGDVNQRVRWRAAPPTSTPASMRSPISNCAIRPPRAQIGLGVSNLFDVYPDRQIAANNSTGRAGLPLLFAVRFNGRYLYARVGINW